jgi:hypothetical protein
MKIRTLILSLLLAVFCFDTGQGFALLGYVWPNATYDYFVNPANKDGLAKDPLIAAFKGGANVWNKWCKGVYKGTTTLKKVSFNQKNTVFFRPKKSGLAIATTFIFFTTDRKTILDFDLVYWDAAWKFFTGKTGCQAGFYVQDIAAHEFGHAIGIDHSAVLAATMFPSTVFCNTALRSLHDDDKKAANKAY